MKVLTLWQPHASLCVVIDPTTGKPYKTVETRGWKPPASLIGQTIALHAARKVVYGPIGAFRCETLFSNVQHVADCYCDAGEVDYPCQRRATRTPCLTKPGSEPLMLPLGAIVATCTLVDVVPILGYGEDPNPGKPGWVAHVAETRPLQAGALWHWLGRSEFENLSTGRPTWRYKDISDQRPYGDFTPGRYAWLLADVVPVDPPVPFKGGQGLTKTWTPEAVSA